VDVVPGRALNRDLSNRSDEAAEAEIDRFIERRSKTLEIENQELAEEEAWRESTRRANEKQRMQNRHEWHLHHTSQAERLRSTLEDLIEHHEQRAEKLRLPETVAGD